MALSSSLKADELSIKTTINDLCQGKDIKFTGEHTSSTELAFLFPKLSHFNKILKSQRGNCQLLATPYNPHQQLPELVNFDSGSLEAFFGHFKQEPSRFLAFSEKHYLSEQQPVLISAALLIQDPVLAELLIKTLYSGHFNTRWIFGANSPSEMVTARHRVIPTSLRIVIHGHTGDLNHLLCDWPLLEVLTHSSITEADIAFKPEANIISEFISLFKQRYQHDLTSTQLVDIIWALSRYTEDQFWISLDLEYLDRLVGLLPLNTAFATTDVEYAVNELTGANSHSKLFNYDQIIRGAVKLDVSGEVIGQINGLTVVETSHAEFGEPSRITANVFLGDGDIGDIERKSDLGGNIHAKAMMILSSFVSKTFAHNAPMPVSSNIVFEQSYHEVDGDSASVAELYALLSALAEVPIKQNIALTGAMDQLGNVQAVGGVDLKIESFYDIAIALDDNAKPIVVIPQANVVNLNLSQRILNAVKTNKLEIIPIKHVNDASMILTGLPAESDEQNSLFNKVRESLDRFEGDAEEHPTLKQKIARLLRFSSN